MSETERPLPRKELVSSEQMIGFSSRFLLGGDKVNPEAPITSVENADKLKPEAQKFHSANRAAYDECRQYWEAKNPSLAYEAQKTSWVKDTAKRLTGAKFKSTMAVMQDILLSAANSNNPAATIDKFDNGTADSVLFSIHHRYFESDTQITHSDGSVERQPVNTNQFVKDVLDKYRKNGSLNTDQLKKDLPEIRRFSRIFGDKMMDSIMSDIVVACADREAQPAVLLERANAQVNGKSRVDSTNLNEDERKKLAYLWKYSSPDARFTTSEPLTPAAAPPPPQGEPIITEHNGPEDDEDTTEYETIGDLFADIKASPDTSHEYFVHGAEIKNPVTEANVDSFIGDFDAKYILEKMATSDERYKAAQQMGLDLMGSISAASAETPELQQELFLELIDSVLDIYTLKASVIKDGLQQRIDSTANDNMRALLKAQLDFLNNIVDLSKTVEDIRDDFNNDTLTVEQLTVIENLGTVVNLTGILKAMNASAKQAPPPPQPQSAAGESAKPAQAAKPPENAEPATTKIKSITQGMEIRKKGDDKPFTVTKIEDTEKGKMITLQSEGRTLEPLDEKTLIGLLNTPDSIWQASATEPDEDTVEVDVPQAPPGAQEPETDQRVQEMLDKLRQAAGPQPAEAPAEKPAVAPAARPVTTRIDTTDTIDVAPPVAAPARPAPPAPPAASAPPTTAATPEAPVTAAQPAAEAKPKATTESPPSEFVFDTTQPLLPQLENMVFTRENIALSLGPDLLKKMTDELLQKLMHQRKNIKTISGDGLTIDFHDDKIIIGGEIKGEGTKFLVTRDFHIYPDMVLENVGGAVRIQPGFKIKGSIGTDDEVATIRKKLINIGYDPANELVNFLNDQLKEENVRLTAPRSSIADGKLQLTTKKEKITTSETPIEN